MLQHVQTAHPLTQPCQVDPSPTVVTTRLKRCDKHTHHAHHTSTQSTMLYTLITSSSSVDDPGLTSARPPHSPSSLSMEARRGALSLLVQQNTVSTQTHSFTAPHLQPRSTTLCYPCPGCNRIFFYSVMPKKTNQGCWYCVDPEHKRGRRLEGKEQKKNCINAPSQWTPPIRRPYTAKICGTCKWRRRGILPANGAAAPQQQAVQPVQPVLAQPQPQRPPPVVMPHAPHPPSPPPLLSTASLQNLFCFGSAGPAFDDSIAPTPPSSPSLPPRSPPPTLPAAYATSVNVVFPPPPAAFGPAPPAAAAGQFNAPPALTATVAAASPPPPLVTVVLPPSHAELPDVQWPPIPVRAQIVRSESRDWFIKHCVTGGIRYLFDTAAGLAERTLIAHDVVQAVKDVVDMDIDDSDEKVEVLYTQVGNTRTRSEIKLRLIEGRLPSHDMDKITIEQWQSIFHPDRCNPLHEWNEDEEASWERLWRAEAGDRDTAFHNFTPFPRGPAHAGNFTK